MHKNESVIETGIPKEKYISKELVKRESIRTDNYLDVRMRNG